MRKIWITITIAFLSLNNTANEQEGPVKPLGEKFSATRISPKAISTTYPTINSSTIFAGGSLDVNNIIR